ncbi:glycosyltransferase [Lysinimonas soli]|uniref:Glycosyltransferase n=1 Tax=Lysinimonas soli TaxID=1074233 RepID=A0ABW0NN28_9MICO
MVVVTYNSAEDVGELLDSLREDAGTLSVAVLVADNSSADDTVAVARAHAPEALVFGTGGNIGYAAAINKALAQLDGSRPVMILNPDTEVAPGAIAIMLGGLGGDVGAVVPRFVGDDGTTSLSLRREPSVSTALGDALVGARFRSRPGRFAETVFEPARYEAPQAVEWATGAALLLSPAAIAAVGPWDERFFLYSEETDYFRRVRDAGFRVTYAPQAVIRHSEGGSGSSPRLDALMAVNRIRYVRKHHSRPYAAVYRGLVVLGELLRLGIPGHALALRSVMRERSWARLPGPTGTAVRSGAGSGPVVYLAGGTWDDIPGTDRRLVAALARQGRVVWIDPPVSVLRRRRNALPGFISQPQDGVTRIQTFGPPGLTRPIVRVLSRLIVARRIRSALHNLGVIPEIVVLAASNRRFPREVPGLRVLYVTDDWVGGAGLMGLSPTDTEKTLRRNAHEADLILAISPALADVVATQTGARRVDVLANGTEPVEHLFAPAPAGSPAILIGQLNERLDIGILEELARADVPLMVVGPRADRDPTFGRRLDAVLAAPKVDWLGARPYDDLADLMASASVGVTPYADSPFNRSSFPLKTLQYLGAGLPVVSTDIPAAHWLNAEGVDIADSPVDFVARVRGRIAEGRTSDGDRKRHAFARNHTWDARAARLQELAARTREGAPPRSISECDTVESSRSTLPDHGEDAE